MESGYVIKTYCEEHSKRIDEEQKRQNKRIGELEEAQKQNTELLLTIRDLVSAVKGMQKELEQHGKRLETIESRDGEAWRKAKWIVLTAVLSAIAGWVVHGIIQ